MVRTGSRGVSFPSPGSTAALSDACAAATLSGPLNQFQCWQGVDLAGTALTTVPAVMSPVSCATICLKTPGCTSFSLSLSFKCSLMNMPLQSPYGTTGLNANTRTSCLLKTVGGGHG